MKNCSSAAEISLITLRAATGGIANQATSRYSFSGIAAGEYSICGVKGRLATAAVAVKSWERASDNLTLAAPAAAPTAAAGVVIDIGATSLPGAFVNQGDAPSCSECGSLMVRNGACYKCHNCGATSGCS